MTEQEYNRILEYDNISDDIRVLSELALCFRMRDADKFSYPEIQRMLERAISLCQDELPGVFEDKIRELEKRRDEI